MTLTHDWRFDAIGTTWTITAGVPIPDAARAAVVHRIDAYDAVWSRFRDDSVVRRLATGGGSADFGPEADALFALYTDLAALTGGAVNPLVGRALERLGYDDRYSFVVRGLEPVVPAWPSAEWSAPTLTLARPALVDVGAAGKGQLVDLVTQVLAESGLDDVTVDAGGDLLHGRTEPLRVGLEHPRDPSRAIGVATLTAGQAICASAPNRRTWGDGLHHVLDGRTGRPSEDVIATWCIASSAMVADGAATALFFADPARVADRLDVACARVDAQGRIVHSTNFDVEWLR